MFSDFSVVSMRIFALLSHFLVTCVLLWTRSDCVSVILKRTATNNDFENEDANFRAVLGLNLLLIALKTCTLALLGDITIRLDLCINVFLDICATFFITWMVLDGWDWRVIIYIFLFCSLFPFVYDILCIILYFIRKQFVLAKRVPTVAARLLYCCKRDEQM